MSTECIAVIGAITTVLAGFGGAALGACFAYKTGMKMVQATHKNAIDLMQRQDFNKAATEFRNAFLPELIFLKHNAKIAGTGSSDDLSEFLLSGYIRRHLKALEVFKNHLSAQERADIDKAWKQYCYNKDNPEFLFFEQYFTGMGSKSEKEAKKTLVLERIEDLLKFAKHK
jgi:hypothetical protein